MAPGTSQVLPLSALAGGHRIQEEWGGESLHGNKEFNIIFHEQKVCCLILL